MVVSQQDDWEVSRTVSGALKQLEDLVEMTRLTLLGPDSKERLTQALDTIVERTQDFTDSAYTSHEHRENILLLCDRAKLELNKLLRVGVSLVSIQSSNRNSHRNHLQATSLHLNRGGTNHFYVQWKFKSLWQ